MADTTYSVKVSEDVQEKIKQLVDSSGISSKDFFSNMVANYELELTKKHTPILSNDITEIQQLTKRINNIFIGVGERIETLQTNHIIDIEEQIAKQQNLIDLLTQQVNDYKSSKLIDDKRMEGFIVDKETAEYKSLELFKKVNQLENINIKNDTIISEYKQKIDDLSSIVSEYKNAYEQNKLFQSDINSKSIEIIKLSSTISDMENAKENEIDKLSIEHEKKVHKLLNECRIKQDEQQNRHNEKLNKYEDKVQQLLNDIELLQNKKTVKKNTIKPL